MGKSLVIKGADFSANGIPEAIPVLIWYIDHCTTDAALLDANRVNGGWAFKETENALLQGKTINKLKFIPSVAGTMNIKKASSLTGNATLVASINVTEAQIGVVTEYDVTPFTIVENEYFVLGEANSSAGFKYSSNTEGGTGFYGKVPSATPSSINAPQDLNISVGYYGVIEP